MIIFLVVLTLGLAGCGASAPDASSAFVVVDRVPAHADAHEIVFPDSASYRLADPSVIGWDAGVLSEVEAEAVELGSSAGMVVHRGLVVAAWGEVGRRENSQSLRKSLVSGLIGTLVADGRISLDATLAELDVQDDPPLTPDERRATVRDLLHSRSGVYHSAVYEFPEWKERKPDRGSHAPGERFFYNNWDFNVLETMAERASGRSMGEAFLERIAEPIGMQDFRAADVVELTDRALSERFMGNDSDFPAHPFMISARDLARYGLLYLSRGRWRDRSVLPESWVRESTTGLPTDRDIEYGYLWWIDPDGTWFPGPDLGVPLYFGRGSRGHYLLVIPSLELVVVNRVETGGAGLFAQLRRRVAGSGRVTETDFAHLLRRIVGAHPTTDGGHAPVPSMSAAPVMTNSASGNCTDCAWPDALARICGA
ncbi:MAG: serine hydrolase domain-containing protein [Gemmatimonadota bacterium]